MALAVSRMPMRNLDQPRVRFYDPGSSLAVKKKKIVGLGPAASPPAPLSGGCVLGLECLENVLNVCSVALCRHLLPGCVLRSGGRRLSSGSVSIEGAYKERKEENHKDSLNPLEKKKLGRGGGERNYNEYLSPLSHEDGQIRTG